MRHVAGLTVVFWLTCVTVGIAAEPHPLVGTWKKVAARRSADAEWEKFSDKITMLKHITDTHVSWTVHRNDTREIVAAMGGRVEIDGDKYTESIDHGLGSILTLLDTKQTFQWKVEGNKFTQAGRLTNGAYLEEQFERVTKENPDAK